MMIPEAIKAFLAVKPAPPVDEEKDYVFVGAENLHLPPPAPVLSASGTGVVAMKKPAMQPIVEDIPDADEAIPYMPSLGSSTEIKKLDDYNDTINTAQAFLDSRLLQFSTYSLMGGLTDSMMLLTPRQKQHVQLVTEDEDFVMPFSQKKHTVGMGWSKCPSLDRESRECLRQLEEHGVSYEPHDTAYSVKYLAPVLPFGDCLFLSMEQLTIHTEGVEHLSPSRLRHEAAKHFYMRYASSSHEEKAKMDQTIRNLYYPDLRGGWGVSPTQARRFVAPRADKDWFVARIYELQDRGYSWTKAAEMVYSEHAQPVLNVETYCKYMCVGSDFDANEHFLICMTYSRHGLVSIDNDPDNRRSLATAFQRDIFVVLVGMGQMFFLPHRPHELDPSLSLSQSQRHTGEKGLSPWFILMRMTGGDRGGDHYEPMHCQRLRGDGYEQFGTIGDM
ncbi:hypothetical protein SPRG_02149 [Saprolegnia parasitica CBS 223.65]|uniref:OTU domain-containing protein n=1 Tax=Saprolegnia parasitica (strain CBS 223.65) TaxID=695850 RepID=A0A067D2T8_SAPPC|nr:hypothetical protein SPRG_02149 [Saprolegnia parasitica CBS 223.65]KDO33342.1 hypothetical protein SPRG_02149 [Saprolegnia parasitica CBS 223.65]|eukprot:XP_012196090.1 hypothetical protein SPRG_02149 [Saprolegnia parasitica CBS 223.65]